MINKKQITAIILAGGRARRMYGQDKGLIKLNKKPLIQYVIDVIKHQVKEVLINANRNLVQYQVFSKQAVIVDDMADFQGPLAGFAAGLKVAKTQYLLVLPCDCPMIHKELIPSLINALYEKNGEISIADDGNRIQPTFALLKVSLLSSLLQYLQNGGRKIDKWYAQHKTIKADLSAYKDSFVNLNNPCDYALFTKPQKINDVAILGFSAFSGTGKTTLLTQVIRRLTAKNIRIAYLKHAHHNFEIDHPNKDSYECYHSGARQVLISSDDKFALISRNNGTELGLSALIERLDLNQLDLILVEGFKSESIKKIELYRHELNKPLRYQDDDNIIAIASTKTDISCNIPVMDLNNIAQISDFIMAYANYQISP